MGREDELVKQFEPACYRYAQGLASEGMDPEDFVQELRIAALLAIRSWEEGKGAKLSTWVINGIKLRVRTLVSGPVWSRRRSDRQSKYSRHTSLQDEVSDVRTSNTSVRVEDLVGEEDDTLTELCLKEFRSMCFEKANDGLDRDVLLDLLSGEDSSAHKKHNVTRSTTSLRRIALRKRIIEDERCSLVLP